MISFIVIGRNEGLKLKKCFDSICRTINVNKISNFEVIYIDSNSSDDSISIAKNYENFNIFKIMGKYNAAIARNIGAKESKGDVLFFIDGDMELIPEFLQYVFDNNFNLKYNFVSGQFENYCYDYKGNLLKTKYYHRNVLEKDSYNTSTGGLFIINRTIWNSVNGMRNKYRRSQDLDLGLRLAKKGVQLLRKKELMAIHNTIEYNDKIRMWKDLFTGVTLYGRSVLYRDHILNKYIYPRIIKRDPTFLSLLIILIISFMINLNLLFSYTIYISIVITIYLILKFKEHSSSLTLIPYYIIRDHLTLFSILFFYPTNNIELKYEKIP